MEKINIKYNAEISNQVISNNLNRLINQTYKLLPSREEGADWQLPLSTIMEELAGMHSLLGRDGENFFMLLCKMEGMFSLNKEKDFSSFRRTIFECIGLIGDIKKQYDSR